MDSAKLHDELLEVIGPVFEGVDSDGNISWLPEHPVGDEQVQADDVIANHDPDALTDIELAQLEVKAFLSTYAGQSVEDNFDTAGATMMRALYQYVGLADSNGNVKDQ